MQLARSQTVYALKVADVQTELQTLEMLSALMQPNKPLPPIIPFLITSTAAECSNGSKGSRQPVQAMTLSEAIRLSVGGGASSARCTESPVLAPPSSFRPPGMKRPLKASGGGGAELEGARHPPADGGDSLPPKALDGTTTTPATGINRIGGDASAPPAMVEGLSYSEMEASVRGYIQRFGLNPGQASVLLHIASWLTPPHSEPRKETTMSERTEVPGDGILSKDACSLQPPPTPERFQIPARCPPVCLIHGPFGSGKSTLLVAIIMMVSELVRPEGREHAFSGHHHDGLGAGKTRGEEC